MGLILKSGFQFRGLETNTLEEVVKQALREISRLKISGDRE
jgi:hypothetical protein